MADIQLHTHTQDIEITAPQTKDVVIGATAEQLLPLIDVNQKLATSNKELAENVLPTLRGGLQTKEVTLTDIEQTITPDDGYLGLQKVIVPPQERDVQVVNMGYYNMPSEYYDNVVELAVQHYRSDYASSVVCSIYKDSTDTISLLGADAYLTSDGDFYESAGIHTWHDSRELVATRWVCFFFKNESAVFQISSAISNVINIGVCGRIETLSIESTSNVEGVFVEQNSSVGSLSFHTSNNLKPQNIIKNIREHNSGFIYKNNTNRGICYVDIQEVNGGEIFECGSDFDTIVCLTKTVDGGNIFHNYNTNRVFSNLKKIVFPNLEIVKTHVFNFTNYGAPNLVEIEMPKLKEIRGKLYNDSNKSIKMPFLQEIHLPSVTYIDSELGFLGLKYVYYESLVVANIAPQCADAEIIAPLLEEIHCTSSNPTIKITAQKLRLIDMSEVWADAYVYASVTRFVGINILEEIIVGCNRCSVFYGITEEIITMQKIKKIYAQNAYYGSVFYGKNSTKKLLLPSVETISNMRLYLGGTCNIEYLYVGCKGDASQIIYLPAGVNNSVSDIEIGKDALQNITLTGYSNLTRENIVNHILIKLGDNKNYPTLTLSLGATNLAKLTSEDKAIATSKNWTLA